DRLALAGAVDAVHEDEHGKLRVREELVLQREQPLAKLGLLAIELALRELVADLRGFEHALTLPPRRATARFARARAPERARCREGAADSSRPRFLRCRA